MQAIHIQYVLLGALAIALLIAAVTDWHSRTIANWLNGAIALGAPFFWWASGMALWPDIAMQLGVAFAAFVILAGLFAIRAMGGGDVKLLTALALWIKPDWFVSLLIIMAVIGGLLTIVLAINHTMRRRKSRLKIPYGIAISAAGLWVLGMQYVYPHFSTGTGLSG